MSGLPARIHTALLPAANDEAAQDRAPTIGETMAGKIIPLATMCGGLALAWQVRPALDHYARLADMAPYEGIANWAMWTLADLADPALRALSLLTPLVVVARPGGRERPMVILCIVALLAWSSLGAWSGLAFLNAETRAVACEVATFFGGECALARPSAGFIAFAAMTVAAVPVLGWSLARDLALTLHRRPQSEPR